MEVCRRIFQEMAGEDESGSGRTLCCLMILASDGADVARQYLGRDGQDGREENGEGDLDGAWTGDQRYEPESCGAVYLEDAVLAIRFKGDFVVVDLRFGDCVDFEYLQAGELCRKYEVLAEGRDAEGERMDYSLVLSVVPKGEYDVFFVGLDGVWSFVSEEPGGICHIIRLVFAREKVGGYEFGEKMVEEIVGDVMGEMYEVNEMNEEINWERD